MGPNGERSELLSDIAQGAPVVVHDDTCLYAYADACEVAPALQKLRSFLRER